MWCATPSGCANPVRCVSRSCASRSRRPSIFLPQGSTVAIPMDPSTTNPVPPAHPAPLDPVLLEDPAARCPAFPPVNTQSLRADADLVDPVDPHADLADQDAVPADLADHLVQAVVLADPVDLDHVASVLVVLARRGSNWLKSQRLPKKSRDAPTFWKSVSEPKYIPVQNRLCKFRIIKKCV